MKKEIVEGEVGAVDVVGAVGVAGLDPGAAPERRFEIAGICEPPVVAATSKGRGVRPVGRAGPEVLEPADVEIPPRGGKEVPRQPRAQLVALVGGEVALGIDSSTALYSG